MVGRLLVTKLILLKPEEFNWIDAPINKIWQPLLAIGGYLALINFLEWKGAHYPWSSSFLKRVKKVQACHNLGICLFSLVMVIGCAIASIKAGYFDYKRLGLEKRGLEFLICEVGDAPSAGPLFYWVYIFYLTKYWELLDTILQMLKGRRPPSYHFHVWHHTVYLVICFFYMEARSSLAVLAVMTNGSIHVLMYYYYFLVCLDKTPVWKPIITQVQIGQFIWGYLCLTSYVLDRIVTGNQCRGGAVLSFHAIFNMTMLVGFLRILTRVKKNQNQTTSALKDKADNDIIVKPLKSQKSISSSSSSSSRKFAMIQQRPSEQVANEQVGNEQVGNEQVPNDQAHGKVATKQSVT